MFYDFTHYHNIRNSYSVLRKQTKTNKNLSQVSQPILTFLFNSKANQPETHLWQVLFVCFNQLTILLLPPFHAISRVSNSKFPPLDQKKKMERKQDEGTKGKKKSFMQRGIFDHFISDVIIPMGKNFSTLLSNNHSHMVETKGGKIQRSSGENISSFACADKCYYITYTSSLNFHQMRRG